MDVYAFRGPERVFGFTEDRDGANLPAELGPWTPFKSLTLQRGNPQPGLNVEECLDDIAAHGFDLTDAHVRITEKFSAR